MLRFATVPDEAFQAILEAFLEISIDMLKDSLQSGEGGNNVFDGYLEQTRALFTPQELLNELEKLLKAHRSPDLYMPTDYHFLLLYDVLSQLVDFHNDTLQDEGGKKEYGSICIGKIDFYALTDCYFWDLDFLLNAEVINKMHPDFKKTMGFNKETFGVVNRLRPDPKELELQIVHEEEEPQQAESYYKRGEAYPYHDPEEFCDEDY
ncbi:MAG: hypothetical protein ACMUIP_10195 [bacterium]